MAKNKRNFNVFKPKKYKFNKKDFNLSEKAARIERILEKGVDPGAFCTEIDEDVPTFAQAKCEIVYKNSNNAFIVLGRDRPESKASGCGGKGYTGCGMIDLVVGRGAVHAAENKKALTTDDMIGPSFANDAARIYITQKSLGIDSYLGMTNTKTDSKHKSAIAIKSDHTRIVGRESVRIYASSGQAFTKAEKASNGQSLSAPKIELIAGGEGEDAKNIHPVVLGNNLVEYLNKQNEAIRDLMSAVTEISTQLAAVNAGLAVVTFGAPPFSTNIIKNVNQVMDGIFKSLNTHIETVNSLDNGIMKGGSSLLSNNVFTT